MVTIANLDYCFDSITILSFFIFAIVPNMESPLFRPSFLVAGLIIVTMVILNVDSLDTFLFFLCFAKNDKHPNDVLGARQQRSHHL